MDALVAERVLGLSLEHLPVVYEEGNTEDGKDGWSGFVCPRCRRPADMLDEPCVKRYSTDIAAAWKVVEKINRMWAITRLPSENIYQAAFIDRAPLLEVAAETAPLAICRAALLAVMEP